MCVKNWARETAKVKISEALLRIFLKKVNSGPATFKIKLQFYPLSAKPTK